MFLRGRLAAEQPPQSPPPSEADFPLPRDCTLLPTQLTVVLLFASTEALRWEARRFRCWACPPSEGPLPEAEPPRRGCGACVRSLRHTHPLLQPHAPVASPGLCSSSQPPALSLLGYTPLEGSEQL